MDKSKLRFPSAYFVGLFLSMFGVFIFGKFEYMGLTLQDNIFPLMSSSGDAAVGFYQLFGSGFMVDLFKEFSAENLQDTTAASVFFGPVVWPCIITWFMVGFISGSIVKGAKRGLILSLTILFTMFILWVITGFFAGEDMSSIYQQNFATRMSELFTAIIFTVPSCIIAGWITGPFER